jgi:hypothetical protein
MFGEHMELEWPYFSQGQPLREEQGIGDYVAYAGDGLVPWGFEEGVKDFENPNPVTEFAWGLADHVTALLDAGLRLNSLREYPYSNGAKRFANQVEGEGRRMYPPEGVPAMPMMFSIVASREP